VVRGKKEKARVWDKVRMRPFLFLPGERPRGEAREKKGAGFRSSFRDPGKRRGEKGTSLSAVQPKKTSEKGVADSGRGGGGGLNGKNEKKGRELLGKKGGRKFCGKGLLYRKTVALYFQRKAGHCN